MADTGTHPIDPVSPLIPDWLRLVGQVGVPAGIAIYLVWVLANDVKGPIASQQTAINHLVLSVAQIATEHQEMKLTNLQIVRILSATCVNAAKDPMARERCFQ